MSHSYHCTKLIKYLLFKLKLDACVEQRLATWFHKLFVNKLIHHELLHKSKLVTNLAEWTNFHLKLKYACQKISTESCKSVWRFYFKFIKLCFRKAFHRFFYFIYLLFFEGWGLLVSRYYNLTSINLKYRNIKKIILSPKKTKKCFLLFFVSPTRKNENPNSCELTGVNEINLRVNSHWLWGFGLEETNEKMFYPSLLI